MLKKGFLGLAVIVVLLMIAGALNPSPKGAATPVPGQAAPAASPQATAASVPTVKPAVASPTSKPAPVWTEVTRFSGKAIKDTPTFSITADEWRVSWDTKPGEFGPMNFQIFVYKVSGSSKAMAGVIANVIGEDRDSSVMRGRGDYYLTINTGQPYTVVVEQRQ